jgi:predicted signal transduction protein with EAL and GGDEF domain
VKSVDVSSPAGPKILTHKAPLACSDALPVAITDLYPLKDFNDTTGISAGTNSSPTSPSPGLTLMTRADAAVYAAKRAGRDRCEILLYV